MGLGIGGGKFASPIFYLKVFCRILANNKYNWHCANTYPAISSA